LFAPLAQTIEKVELLVRYNLLGTVVDENDPVWSDTSVDKGLCVRHIQDGPVNDDARRLELQRQLQIGQNLRGTGQ